MTVLLAGTVGSTAYGLATASSDIDTLGIFIAPTRSILGLDHRKVEQSIVRTNPDSTYHEVGKYISLALKGNPTVLELFWLPEHTVRHPAIDPIFAMREDLLSAPAVYNAYGGYARQQADRLLRRQEDGKDGFSSDVKKRTAKHGRHCVRLLIQGSRALAIGEIPIDMTDHRDYIFECGELAANDPDAFSQRVDTLFETFAEYYDGTVLPQAPARDKFHEALVELRIRELEGYVL